MHRRIWRFIEEQLAAVDFRNKSVLDIGCWDGYWSSYAERRGAKSVLASDDFTQNWGGEKGLHLAKELLKSRVQVNPRLSVYDVGSLGQQFDIILFLGVYYHLFDPFYAFAQIRKCCHPGTIVCIEGNEGLGMAPNSAILNPEGGEVSSFARSHSRAAAIDLFFCPVGRIPSTRRANSIATSRPPQLALAVANVLKNRARLAGGNRKAGMLGASDFGKASGWTSLLGLHPH